MKPVYTYPVTGWLKMAAAFGKRWFHSYTERSVHSFKAGRTVQRHDGRHWKTKKKKKTDIFSKRSKVKFLNAYKVCFEPFRSFSIEFRYWN